MAVSAFQRPTAADCRFGRTSSLLLSFCLYWSGRSRSVQPPTRLSPRSGPASDPEGSQPVIITDVEVELKENPASPNFNWRKGLPGSEPAPVSAVLRIRTDDGLY